MKKNSEKLKNENLKILKKIQKFKKLRKPGELESYTQYLTCDNRSCVPQIPSIVNND